MEATGNTYENAQAEIFLATLKQEEVYLSEYDDMAEVLNRISYFIEYVYNGACCQTSQVIPNIPIIWPKIDKKQKKQGIEIDLVTSVQHFLTFLHQISYITS
jgi:hypothetical protein